MDRFIDYMTTKRYMAGARQAVIASGGDPYAESRARLIAAITTLLTAGISAGTIRAGVEPNDVLLALSGVSLAAGATAATSVASRPAVAVPDPAGRIDDHRDPAGEPAHLARPAAFIRSRSAITTVFPPVAASARVCPR
jgi:hypothetical protein